MENNYSSSHRIARIIALIDELWSVIDLLFTFIIHFGGEHVNGIFYQLELQVDRGILPPNQVIGRRALLGLLFFVSLLVNSLWIFGAYILFKATETTAHCTASSRRRLQYCKIWLSISILLLTLHGLNMCIYITEIYITESFLQMGFALSAFLTRSVFVYFVRKFMRELELGSHLHHGTTTTVINMQPIVHFARREGHTTDQETDTLVSSSPSSSSTRNGDVNNRNRSRATNHNSSSNSNNNRKYMIVSTTPTHAQIPSNNHNNNGHGPPTTTTTTTTNNGQQHNSVPVTVDSPRHRQAHRHVRDNRAPRSSTKDQQSMNEGHEQQVRSNSAGPSSSSASSSRTVITLNPLGN